MLPLPALFRRVALLSSIVTLCSCAPHAGAAPSALSWERKSSEWKHFDKLIGDAKYAEAAGVSAQILATAATPEERAAALIEHTRLRIALGGYETAVKRLKAEKWPHQLVPRVVVELFYVQALQRYV